MTSVLTRARTATDSEAEAERAAAVAWLKDHGVDVTDESIGAYLAYECARLRKGYCRGTVREKPVAPVRPKKNQPEQILP